MPARPWLPKVRKLLGVLPDAEIARRVGVSKTTVRDTRAALGIKGRIGRDLDDVGADGTLKLISARARSGKSMRASDVEGSYLPALCNRFFGGWYQAVEAAGLKPVGKPLPRRAHLSPPEKRPLTPALLRGPKSATELERLTGLTRSAIVHRRKQLGIVRDNPPKTSTPLTLDVASTCRGMLFFPRTASTTVTGH